MAGPSVQVPGGLEYWDCTVPELRGFIKARTGKAPPTRTRKAGLVSILHQLDVDPDPQRKFRFLDLPAELRNAVYRELLTLRSSALVTVSCFPIIIATCRQVHGEARSILYGDNALQITISSWPEPQVGPPGRILRSVSIFGRQEPCRVKRPQDRGTLWESVATWPDFLLKFETLQLNIVHGNTMLLPAYAVTILVHKLAIATNHQLTVLGSFLSTSTALKSIDVKFNHFPIPPDTPDVESNLQLALTPIALLPCAKHFNITGPAITVHLTKTLRDYSAFRIASDQPMVDEIARYRTLREKAEAIWTCINISGVVRGKRRLAMIKEDLDKIFASHGHLTVPQIAAREDAAKKMEEMLENRVFDEAYGAVEDAVEKCRDVMAVIKR